MSEPGCPLRRIALVDPGFTVQMPSRAWRRLSICLPVVAAGLLVNCGNVPYRRKPEPMPGYVGSTYTPPPAKAEAPPPEPSPLADKLPVAFRANFFTFDLGPPWNVFGADAGKRVVKGGPEGLWIQVSDGEKAWDAVSARTSRLKAEGDFDLRGRFRKFAATGNGSAKLIVVDADYPRRESAYVERLQLDGKNLIKFGGDVDGSSETWGFVASDAASGDLRLMREGGSLRAFTRPDERSSWTEFAPAQTASKSFPRIVKFGVKVSADEHKSAEVLWTELTINGTLVRSE